MRVRIRDEWPPAISDGVTLPCGVCGGHLSFDYTVTDEAWRLCVPEDMRLGAVCLDCFDGLAEARGIYVGDVLEAVQFTGRGETVELWPGNAFRYGDDREAVS